MRKNALIIFYPSFFVFARPPERRRARPDFSGGS
jgi:hypothetical protein